MMLFRLCWCMLFSLVCMKCLMQCLVVLLCFFRNFDSDQQCMFSCCCIVFKVWLLVRMWQYSQLLNFFCRLLKWVMLLYLLLCVISSWWLLVVMWMVWWCICMVGNISLYIWCSEVLWLLGMQMILVLVWCSVCSVWMILLCDCCQVVWWCVIYYRLMMLFIRYSCLQCSCERNCVSLVVW